MYMEQLSSFVNPSLSNHVFLLNESFYGLKQAYYAWFEC